MSQGEQVFRVAPGSPGNAVGPAVRWRRPALSPPAPARAGSADEESARLGRALDQARRELSDTVARVTSRAGEAEARLFRTHLAFLDDPLVIGPIGDAIHRGLPAEQAVQTSISALGARFDALRDERLRERAADIRDVGQRLLARLARAAPEEIAPPAGCIVCAESLTISEVVVLAGAAAGVVLGQSGATSHAVILARALGLPAVLGAGAVLDRVQEGDPVLLDGADGTVVLHPGPETLSRHAPRVVGTPPPRREADGRDRPALTRDGHRVWVLASVGGPAEAAAARDAGAEGVGLVRTEFLFLGRDTLPSEDEQLDAYRQVLTRMAPRRVVFRVLDVGADKPLPALPQPAEPNPALGLRGIRLCLAREDVFRTQLLALTRASQDGAIGILLPMVSDVEEVRRTRRILSDVRRELAARGGPEPPPASLGVMVETPAAALMVRELAEEADFISLGTNDLVQYVLAADRQGGHGAEMYQPFHPAVLRLLSHVVESAAARGRPATVCGEIAADPLAVPLLVGMGVGALSVTPPAVGTVREAIRALERSEARALLDEVLVLATTPEVVERLRRVAAPAGRTHVRADRHGR